MADEQKIIFSSEFQGDGIDKAAKEMIDNLEKVKSAQTELKEESKALNEQIKANEKELEKLNTLMKTSSGAAKDSLSKSITDLSNNNVVLKNSLTNVNKELIVVGKGVSFYNKEINETIRNNTSAKKAIGDFTNFNKLAGEGVKRFTGEIKNLGLGLVSGLAGGLIATVIPTVFEFVESLFDGSKALTELQKNQKLVNEVLGQGAKNAGAEVAKLEALRAKLTDTNVKQSDRIRLAKEYNKTAEEANKIDLQQIDNLELINQKIDAQNKLILQRAISTAALAKLTEASTAFVDQQLKLDEKLKQTGLKEGDVLNKTIQSAAGQMQNVRNLQQSLDNFNKGGLSPNRPVAPQPISLTKEEKEVLSLIQGRDFARESLDKMAALLNPLITAQGLSTAGGGGTTATIENVFEQKLKELKARLADITQQSFQSDDLIKQKFAAGLEKELGGIADLLKAKKLTGKQADILNDLLTQINDVELKKGLKEFADKRKEAIDRVNDEIIKLQTDAATKQVENLTDQFEREKAAIEANFNATIQALNKSQSDIIKKLQDDVDKGILTPAQGKEKTAIINALFGDLATQAGKAKIQKQTDLAFKIFQDTVAQARIPFEIELLKLSEKAAEDIQRQTKLFLSGKINYEKYQKELTKIAKDEAKKRRDILIQEAQTELDSITKRLTQTTDKESREKLEQRQRELRGQIADLNKQSAEAEGKDQNDKDKERIDKIMKYVEAVQQLASTVAAFWNQVNQAEAASLDRSIALQNKRVENAREIAEKGNAEYLELEQQRLDELERKREDNARKQIAINNALTLSQATVAAITAIAKAVESGSPIAAIAAVSAVVGAIAAAFAFVNSIQPQTPTFFEGSEVVTGAGSPLGKDTVKARLHIGERVVTAKDNKDYWQTLTAIHNHMIPADALNSFVASYPEHNIPVVDFSRLSGATNLGSDSHEVASKLDSLNGSIEQVVEAVRAIGFNVKMDEDGFSASLSSYARRAKIRKRS